VFDIINRDGSVAVSEVRQTLVRLIIEVGTPPPTVSFNLHHAIFRPLSPHYDITNYIKSEITVFEQRHDKLARSFTSRLLNLLPPRPFRMLAPRSCLASKFSLFMHEIH